MPPGYRVTPQGAWIGLGYGFGAGFLLGWGFGLLRNVYSGLVLLIFARRAEVRSLRGFLDHI